MIVCGDMIDARFGYLGLTTMAAAGLGNWVSDTVGLGIGDAIERTATRLGLSNGGLTAAQERMQIAKFTTLGAKIIGITLGCFAGMCPLLMITPTKTEFSDEDLEVYDVVFRPYGNTTAQFQELMKLGTRRSVKQGQAVVTGGKPFAKIVLLLRGEAVSYPTGSQTAIFKYVGRLPLESSTDEAAKLTTRGSIIGGSAFTNESKLEESYPNDVIASTPVDCLEWNFSDLQGLMKAEPAIQASIFSILYGEIVHSLREEKPGHRLKIYSALLKGVLADGYVAPKEREELSNYRLEHHITEVEHLKALEEIGWSKESFYQGWREQSGEEASRTPATLQDAVQQLEAARALLDSVLKSTRESSPKAA